MSEILQTPYWLHTCDRLKYCADLLIRELQTIDDRSDLMEKERIQALLETNLLLLGYSVENALKGLLISNFLLKKTFPLDADFIFLRNNVWPNSKSHELLTLAKTSGLTFTNAELDLLNKLEKYTTWKGRYHIPKPADQIKGVTRQGQGDRHTSHDQTLVNEIIEKIKSKITSNGS